MTFNELSSADYQVVLDEFFVSDIQHKLETDGQFALNDEITMDDVADLLYCDEKMPPTDACLIDAATDEWLKSLVEGDHSYSEASHQQRAPQIVVQTGKTLEKTPLNRALARAFVVVRRRAERRRAQRLRARAAAPSPPPVAQPTIALRHYKLNNSRIIHRYHYDLSDAYRDSTGSLAEFIFFRGTQSIERRRVPLLLSVATLFTERAVEVNGVESFIQPFRTYQFSTVATPRSNRMIIFSFDADVKFRPSASLLFPKPRKIVIPRSSSSEFNYLCVTASVYTDAIKSAHNMCYVAIRKAATSATRDGPASTVFLFHYVSKVDDKEAKPGDVTDVNKGRFYFTLLDDLAARNKCVLLKAADNSRETFNVSFSTDGTRK